MKTYRRKPLVVTAVKFTGENYEDIARFCLPIEVDFVYNSMDDSRSIILRGIEGDPEIIKVTDFVVKESGSQNISVFSLYDFGKYHECSDIMEAMANEFSKKVNENEK